MTTVQMMQTSSKDAGPQEAPETLDLNVNIFLPTDPGNETLVDTVQEPPMDSGPIFTECEAPAPPSDVPEVICPEDGQGKNLYRVNICQKITRIPGNGPITGQPSTASATPDHVIHPSLRKLKDQEFINIYQRCSNYCCCFIKESIYRVKDDKGNPMFTIREESSTGMRCCCCWSRSFVMRIRDTEEKEMMLLRRPVTCGQCYCWCCNYCMPCCLSEMDVSGSQPPHRNFGRVVQDYSFFSPSFTCLNDLGQEAFKVTGNCCRMPCSSHFYKAEATGRDISSLGMITKKWTTCITECCTNAHHLHVRFEKETSLEDRVMMLSSAILIDFLYYT